MSRITWSVEDAADWDKPVITEAVTFDGTVIALQPSQLSSVVYALVRHKRKWWQFWMPPEYERWHSVKIEPTSR
jgi:hypothetical protein